MEPEAEAWEVRVRWEASPGVTCPEFTVYAAPSESAAVDEAVSILDGNQHHRALVKAVGAEIRRVGDAGPWRTVAAGRARSYL